MSDDERSQGRRIACTASCTTVFFALAPPLPHPGRMRIARRILAAVFITVFTVGCGELDRLPALGEVRSAALTVYALSGTDIGLPSGLNVAALVVVPVTGVFDFQLAFDINAEGQAVIHPVALIAAEGIAVPRVGLLEVEGTFEELTSAPRGPYVYDQSIVATKGKVIAIEAGVPCPQPYPNLVFAKLVVDTVDTARRSIGFRATTDQSCGFRSFLPGIPKN